MFLDSKDWTLDFTKFVPEEEKTTEALCAVGNGYMGTRGAFEESVSSDCHYPGTYMPGLYNILESQVGDRVIENEDFVNCPNWTSVTFKINDDEWFDISKVEVLDYHKQLNFKHGQLVRKLRFKDDKDRITTVESLRFVSMHSKHLACVRYVITPENYSGEICVRSALDGDISNQGVDRYKQLNSLHLAPVSESYDEKGICLSAATNQSSILIEMAARNCFYVGAKKIDSTSNYVTRKRYAAEESTFQVNEGQSLRLDKIVSIVTSRDRDERDTQYAAGEELLKAEDFDTIHSQHCVEWDTLWEKADIEIEGAEDVQRVLRFHTYHLLITASKNNIDIDASIPARGLHGEAYRGHIFWDELYIFPFYYLHFPEITKACLLYRYRRIDKAREYAAEHGYKGAMYPWQTGSSGREETQVIHLNPKSGEWGPDNDSLQRHVSLAIAYNTWMYYQTTEDREFLYRYGAEMLLEIARFWSSKAALNEKTGNYEIDKVMGPNEYHEMAPGAKEGGLKDNAYTNVLTVWLMNKCLDLQNHLAKEELKEIEEKISLDKKEKERWRDIAAKMNLVIKDDIISQHDGFLNLKELDWDAYRKKYKDIGRMDRILKADGLSPDDYQVSKQADWLMTFYVLSVEEVIKIFHGLGYTFNSDILRKNYDYYLARTSHGSTLSLIAHARVAALLNDIPKSIEWFKKALYADIGDIQGGTVKEGIHTGLMAGTIFVFLTAFAGVDFFGERISFRPSLPEEWKRIKCNFTFKNVDYFVTITHGNIKIVIDNTDRNEVLVSVLDKEYQLKRGKEVEIGF